MWAHKKKKCGSRHPVRSSMTCRGNAWSSFQFPFYSFKKICDTKVVLIFLWKTKKCLSCVCVSWIMVNQKLICFDFSTTNSMNFSGYHEHTKCLPFNSRITFYKCVWNGNYLGIKILLHSICMIGWLRWVDIHFPSWSNF